MNKTELYKAIATETGLTQKLVKQVMEGLQTVTFSTLKTEEVKLMDGVTLSSVYKEASTGRNPQTGEAIEVPAKYMPKCKFGAPIKAAINE